MQIINYSIRDLNSMCEQAETRSFQRIVFHHRIVYRDSEKKRKSLSSITFNQLGH